MGNVDSIGGAGSSGNTGCIDGVDVTSGSLGFGFGFDFGVAFALHDPRR